MSRRSGFGSIMTAVARDIARSQRQAEAARKRSLREYEQSLRIAQREQVRQTKIADREAKQQYFEDRIAEAEDKTSVVSSFLEELNSMLEHTPSVNDEIVFDSLQVTEKFQEKFQEFSPSPDLMAKSSPPLKDTCLARKPVFPVNLFPWVKKQYQKRLTDGEKRHKEAISEYETKEQNREELLASERSEYEKAKTAFDQKVAQRCQEIEDFKIAYAAGDRDAIVSYNSLVLERSQYPDGFPQQFRLAYIPESKEIAVEYMLPLVDIVPTILEYKFTRSKDTIDEKSRKPTEIKEIYKNIIASITLRTIHEIFEADQGNCVSVVVFNGMIETIDLATGKEIKPCLISLRVTKDRFLEVNLSKVDKLICLRNLGAQVSSHPAEIQAVKPIVDFDMVDKRYVNQQDIMSDLDNRPNLMDLDPFEFENLVSNLFQKMGLETKQTRCSKDGGVDAVAFDTRPVLGGKVIIQAKRYKNVVGVSAVRDLYGTMINEGASKGILVATSHYGTDAYNFSKDKPIELIDGGALLYLLDQVGIKVKIIIPNE
ncbi:restriction endonuclease [Candidatus Wirthbacteria bacterium CG2_30_54_11]|uniref:Restriction endonuclease n=1 Tax=Candidatus Wirthbacteria bacterium CG2_30_54_11 TaxID=1817892 RepID=A0A1J5IGQ3_9BACT|nr:MAG: restriction endonuclease [Candidatus Wirthbacteria bacterium CG2_30_54_11]